MRRWIFLFVITICIVGGVRLGDLGLIPAKANAQINTQVDEDVSDADEGDVTDIGSLRNFWRLTEKGGKIRWAIFFVLFLGIFVISLKSIELILDRIKSKELANADFRGMSFPQLKALVDRQPQNLFSRLFFMMNKVFSTTASAEGFREEIGSYIQTQQDSFKTFQTRMAFLSDTAGALGLLGTVWGIFITFFSGNVDSQLMVSGMGIALITTLMGLIVSMILNLCSTEIFSVFNKRMDLVAIKAEEFRLRLMEIQQFASHKELVREPEVTAAPEKMTEEETIEKKEIAPTVVVEKPTVVEEVIEPGVPVPYEIQLVDGNNQTGEVMSKLKKLLTVAVVSEDGTKLQGINVRFDVIDNMGKLNGDFSVQELKTDSKGFASCSWMLGAKSGQHFVKVTSDSLEEKTFVAEAISARPESLKIIEGNAQNAKCNQILPNELVIKLTDKYENNIEDYEITFKVMNGNGIFPDFEKDSKITLRTNTNGQARVKYQLGPNPGFNSIRVSANQLKAGVEFQELAQ